MSEQGRGGEGDAGVEAVRRLARVLSGATHQFADLAAEAHLEQARNLLASVWLAEHMDNAEMLAFVAGWFAHARNPKDSPLLVEEAWHAYRLINSVHPTPPADTRNADGAGS